MRKWRSRSFLQNTNAITCHLYTRAPCTGLHKAVCAAEFSSCLVKKLPSIHSLAEANHMRNHFSVLCLFPFHRGCVSLVQTGMRAERRPLPLTIRDSTWLDDSCDIALARWEPGKLWAAFCALETRPSLPLASKNDWPEVCDSPTLAPVADAGTAGHVGPPLASAHGLCDDSARGGVYI